MARLLATLLVLMGLALLGCGDDETTDTTTTSAAEITTTESAAVTTTTTAPEETTTTSEAELANVAVAVDGEGRVVVLDAQTGEELRELLDGVRVDDPAKNSLSLTPDRSTAYVALPAAAGEAIAQGEIIRVDLSGEIEPEVLVQGMNPAVSPDGGTLAYVAFSQGEPFPEPVLVLRDLDSGEERRLTRAEPFFSIGDVAWTSDGGQVVFTAGEIRMGLYTVDRTAADLDEAARLGPTARGDDVSWANATSLGEDRLAVVEAQGDPPGSEGSLVVAVNVPTATVEGGLLPDEDTDATRVDSDPSGQGLLIVVIEGPGEGRLLRWNGGTEAPQLLAEGIVAAAW